MFYFNNKFIIKNRFSKKPHLGLLLSPLSSRRPAVLCLPPPSYNTNRALPGAEPCAIFLRRVHFVPAAPCLFCPPLPKPPSQLMRYLPPPSPTSPSQPLPPDPFLHQGDSSGGGNGKKIVRLLRLLDVCDVCVSGCVQDYVCHPPSQVF